VTLPIAVLDHAPRILLESMRASPPALRSISSNFDISREKISTGMPWSSAAWVATFDGPRGLAHAGPRGHDDEVFGLQARADLIQLGEAGGTPVICRRSMERVCIVDHVAEQLAHRLKQTHAGSAARP